MLNWETLSKTADHEILVAYAPEGRWLVSSHTSSSESRIKFTHNHPDGLNLGDVILKRAKVRSNNPELAEELGKYVHDQDVGIAGSPAEARLVCEVLHEDAPIEAYDELYAKIGYKLRHQFENERGEFFISCHPVYKSFEAWETPESLQVAYEGVRGSEFVLMLSDPHTSEFRLDYPNGIIDYRPYVLRAAERILEQRQAAGNVRKPLATKIAA